MWSLHPELVVDILSRLPVKSLCRFRCVSKSWFNLINHPRFVQMHLARSHRRRLIVYTKSLYSIDLESVSSDDDSVVAEEIDFSRSILNHDIGSLFCTSSCNGLLCVLTEPDELVLFNPSTMECKQILGFQYRPVGEPPSLHGFGYVETIDDYKFVTVERPGKSVVVYSVRENSWRRIKNNLRFVSGYYMQGIPLNGAIHWVVDGHEDSSVIVAFDLVEEKFKTLPPPDIVLEDDSIHTLGLLRGNLCLVSNMSQFWIMNEYGVKASWTRIMIADHFLTLQPLCYLNTNETMLLFKDVCQLVFCNPKDGKVKNVEVHGIQTQADEVIDDGGELFDVDVYVESLVSPNNKNFFTTEEKVLEYWFQ